MSVGRGIRGQSRRAEWEKREEGKRWKEGKKWEKWEEREKLEQWENREKGEAGSHRGQPRCVGFREC